MRCVDRGEKIHLGTDSAPGVYLAIAAVSIVISLIAAVTADRFRAVVQMVLNGVTIVFLLAGIAAGCAIWTNLIDARAYQLGTCKACGCRNRIRPWSW